MDLAIVDAVFRYGAVTGLVMFALILLRDHRTLWPGRLGVATALCTAGYLICSVTDHHSWVEMILRPACIANAVFVWLFGLSLFEDRFRPGRWHWGLLAFVLVRGQWNMVMGPIGGPLLPHYLDGVHQVILIALGGHLAWVAWRGRADDLVETRRRFRLIFIAFLTLMMLVVGSYELALNAESPAAALQALQAFAIWFVVVFMLVRATTLSADAIFFPAEQPVRVSEPSAPSAAAQIAQRDLATLERWIANGDGLYTAALTIGGLADQLKIPEHRVRRLINRELGFRNFNDFLNQYRIEEAKVRLRDPELARLPILTIAMDLGYGSIGPFNRAFKEREEMTPSTYRLGSGD